MKLTNKVIDSFTGEFRFLSNFHPAEIVLLTGKFPSSEHAYQAQKTINFNEHQKFISSANPKLTAGQAKRLGRKVEIRPDWEDIKLSVMKEIVFEKFESHKDLKDKLLATRNAELIEGNTWHDNFFGNCSCSKCKTIPGKNHLGKILMEVREKLQKEEENNV